jgi:hypothetical protein
MKEEFALRIFEGDQLKAVLTTRTSLVLEGEKVKNDLSPFVGLKAILYSITKQKKVNEFVIPTPPASKTESKKEDEETK